MKVKKSVLIITIFALAISCKSEAINISLNRTVVELELGAAANSTALLEAIVTPATSETIVWRSSNESVATVMSGLVVATGLGRAEVTATVGGQSAVCVVFVTHPGGSYHGEWQLVWEENFDGTELNMDNWNIETGGHGWGNREAQHHTGRPENLRVENGNLIIQVRREDYRGNQYTSARITTANKQDFLYGKVEARIKLPRGGGTWPAFWMMGYGRWPYCGEIDIMEHVGNRPGWILHAVHTRLRNGMGIPAGNWHFERHFPNVDSEFNVYGIEWHQNYMFGRDAIHFYVNGERTASIMEEGTEPNSHQWPFNTPFYIILNVAFGGTLGGAIDNSIFDDPNNPVQMKVDWVRVYQKQMP